MSRNVYFILRITLPKIVFEYLFLRWHIEVLHFLREIVKILSWLFVDE